MAKDLSVFQRGAEYGVVHARSTRQQSLTEFLIGELSVPQSRAEELIALGSIYVDDERVRGNDFRLEVQTKIRAHLEPRRYKSVSLKKRILAQHRDYYVVDKPAGLPTHALVDNAKENLLQMLCEELDEKLFITHRLDVETSGMLIIARNAGAQARLNEMIARKQIKRFYSAWVQTSLCLGRLIHFLEPSPKAPKKVSVNPVDGWRRCELEIHSCERETHPVVNGVYRASIELMTGRSQQIRAQLAAMGAPIIGDVKYGSPVFLKDQITGAPAIGLRAERLAGLPN